MGGAYPLSNSPTPFRVVTLRAREWGVFGSRMFSCSLTAAAVRGVVVRVRVIRRFLCVVNTQTGSKRGQGRQKENAWNGPYPFKREIAFVSDVELSGDRETVTCASRSVRCLLFNPCLGFVVHRIQPVSSNTHFVACAVSSVTCQRHHLDLGRPNFVNSLVPATMSSMSMLIWWWQNAEDVTSQAEQPKTTETWVVSNVFSYFSSIPSLTAFFRFSVCSCVA